MRILVADHADDRRKALAEALAGLQPEAELLLFDSALAALSEARKTEIDTAFLRTDLPELSGLDLGRYLKDLNPYVNLIFLADSGTPDYQSLAFEAMKLHASGFLVLKEKREAGKGSTGNGSLGNGAAGNSQVGNGTAGSGESGFGPGWKELIRRELDDLRYPEERKKQKRVFAQTFGNFEFFVDGKPVTFKYTRTKEIVALLINNKGAQTTNGEIIASLWEDDGDPEKKTSYLCNLRQDLQNTFHKLKLDGIIQKQRGSMAIAMDRIDCDLYEWLEKKKKSPYQYMGDYMNQYSWAEFRHAELDEISYAMDEE